MNEVHPGSSVHSRKQMIEDKRVQDHAAKQVYKKHQKKKRKKKKKQKYCDDDDDDDEDEDETYHLSQDYNDDSQVDPEFKPTKEELRKADEKGDS